MSVWLTMLVAGLVTFGTRLSFIYLQDKVRLPDWFRRGLRFVPAAVLSALILPELVVHNGALDLGVRNPELWAGLVAILVAWRTKNVLLTILVGMAALLMMRAVLGHFGML
jgi:branched-subunit amino acid transport protein